jgi:LPXTG-site transpeptidase (sortase) family protein
MVRRFLALRWRLLPLAIAALILSIPLIENVWTKHRISGAAQAAQTKVNAAPAAAKLQGIPNRILIPSLKIDLPVVSQSYSPVIKSWPVASSVANYAAETAPINNTQGQTLIYGHDNSSVFGPLLGMQAGDIVYVYTDNGHLFKYSFSGFRDVSPRQVSVVADMAKAPAGLNLLTCTGAYFQYRHLMSFKFLKAA